VCCFRGGDSAVNYLLILSQVVLSFALPFAVFPLIHVTSSAERMGVFVNGPIAKVVAVVIGVAVASLNVILLVESG
jgi:manganese transport protein